MRAEGAMRRTCGHLLLVELWAMCPESVGSAELSGTLLKDAIFLEILSLDRKSVV